MKPAVSVLLISIALAAPALAQQQGHDHSGHQAPAAGATARASGMTEGEVRKVDKGAARITLKHGEIKSLDMPPMTMVFAVKDKAMLDKVKAGDKVRFKAASDAGTLTVTELELAR